MYVVVEEYFCRSVLVFVNVFRLSCPPFGEETE